MRQKPTATTRTLLLLLILAACAHQSNAQATSAQPAAKANANLNAQTNATPAAVPAGAPAEAATQTGATTQQQPAAEEKLTFMQSEEQDAAGETPSAGGLLVRTLGALLVIVGLVVAAGWGARRFGGARFGSQSTDAPELEVLRSVALGDRRSLAVVRFGGRNLLVGTTAQTITLLSAEGADADNGRGPDARSVADLLRADEEEDFERELSRARADLRVERGEWNAEGGRS